jgi:hypothetical protein
MTSKPVAPSALARGPVKSADAFVVDPVTGAVSEADVGGDPGAVAVPVFNTEEDRAAV